VEQVLLAPPTALLQECPETPIPASGTNGDLLEMTRMLRIDLAECNQKLSRVREWVAQEKRTMEGK
jgi:hypothetical protein